MSDRTAFNFRSVFEIHGRPGMVAILKDGWRLVGSLEYAKESGYPVAVCTVDGWRPYANRNDGTWGFEVQE